MQPDPPDPLSPSALLAAVAALYWFDTFTGPSGTHYGVVRTGTAGANQLLTPVSAGTAGTVAWDLQSPVAAGRIPTLMTQAAYTVLATGRHLTDGSIDVSGTVYWIRLSYDGAPVAVAVAVQA